MVPKKVKWTDKQIGVFYIDRAKVIWRPGDGRIAAQVNFAGFYLGNLYFSSSVWAVIAR